MARFSVLILCLISSLTWAQFSGFGPEIEKYIQEASSTFHISQLMLRGLIKFEDGWYGKTSPTGAMGVGQFTVKTWNWLAQTEQGNKLGMQLVNPKNKGTASDPRANKRINTLAIGLLARWHIDQFSQRNIPLSDENLYLAHNLGLEGFYRARLGKSTAQDIKNMRLNGMKKDMTVSDFLAVQKAKYNRHKWLAHHQSKHTVWIQPNSDNVFILISPQNTIWIQ